MLASNRSATAGTAITRSPASSARVASSRTSGAVGGRDGDEEDLGGGLLGDAGDVGPGAPHRHAADAELGLAGVVVGDGHRQVGAGGVAEHGGDDLLGAVAGAEHEHPGGALVAGALAPLDEQPPAVADGGHVHEGDEERRRRGR